MIPKYNSFQKILNRVFYSPDQTITVFTEDKPSDRILYTTLLERLSNGEFQLTKVMPLGPKKEVIEKSILAQKTKNKSLFIVDADINIMRNEILETENLISLNRYCIENYLCCEEGIISYLRVKLGQTIEQIKADLEFDKFLIQNGKLVLDLYYRLIVSQDLKCGCSFKSASQLFNQIGAPSGVCKNEIKNEISVVEAKIKQKLKSNGVRAFNQEMIKLINEIKAINPHDLDTILKVLSGKDQLMPIIRLKINKLDRATQQLTNDQLKRFLAERINILELGFVKEKILRILN